MLTSKRNAPTKGLVKRPQYWTAATMELAQEPYSGSLISSVRAAVLLLVKLHTAPGAFKLPGQMLR